MSSNLPDPDKIPDMSLGERTDKTLPPPIPSENGLRSDEVEPRTEVKKPASRLPSKAESPPTGWREGDVVLAPWEPTFLYPGVIREIMVDEAKGDQALIAFDDGGEGWVYLYSLCPLEFTVGQKVHARRRSGPDYFPGEIVKVNDEEICVRFDQGDRGWMPITTLRVPCIANGPGATPTKLAPWQTPDSDAVAGSGLPSWAIWIGIVILVAAVRFGCRAMQN